MDDVEFDERVKKSTLSARITMKSLELGELMKWNDLTSIIPFIKFDPDWDVKILPPSSGTTIRFLVKGLGGNVVSVFLDCYDVLGSIGKPYWEIYPYKKGTRRIYIDNVDELFYSIKESIDSGDDLKKSYY